MMSTMDYCGDTLAMGSDLRLTDNEALVDGDFGNRLMLANMISNAV